METQFDVVIVGSGPAGSLAALELARFSGLKVAVLEKTKRLHDTREVANGFMGGSSRSDVRLFLTPGFGGEIRNQHLFPDVLEVLERFGKKRVRRSSVRLAPELVDSLESQELQVDQPEVAVIGSEALAAIEKAMFSFLMKAVDFRSNCEVLGVAKTQSGWSVRTSVGTLECRHLILALGRGGARWASEQCGGLGLKQTGGSYDLGVRLEFPYASFKEYSGSVGFRVRFGDYRTSAVSEHGLVELENVYEVKTTNGRSMAGKGSGYSNFALIKTIQDPEPLQKMLNLVQIVNILADGQLLREPVSRLLNQTSVLCHLPEFMGLRDGIERVLAAFPKIRSRCTLYAPEARLNAARFETSPHGETEQPGLYICGDMSGQTKSFMQAAGSGLLAARNILSKECGLDSL